MAVYFAIRADTGLTSIVALMTDCDETFAVIAFLFIMNVVKGFVADNAFVNARSSVNLVILEYTNEVIR